jgi:hypothetical protein
MSDDLWGWRPSLATASLASQSHPARGPDLPHMEPLARRRDKQQRGFRLVQAPSACPHCPHLFAAPGALALQGKTLLPALRWLGFGLRVSVCPPSIESMETQPPVHPISSLPPSPSPPPPDDSCHLPFHSFAFTSEDLLVSLFPPPSCSLFFVSSLQPNSCRTPTEPRHRPLLVKAGASTYLPSSSNFSSPFHLPLALRLATDCE